MWLGGVLGVGFLIVGLCAVGGGAGAPASDYLSAVPERLLEVQQQWGVLGYDTAAHTSAQPPLPIRIGRQTYRRGLGTHAHSDITVMLDGEYQAFDAEVGLQWQEGDVGTVVFQVFVDGAKRFDSGVMRRDDPARPVHVELAGALQMRLVATDAGDGITCDGANWAEARLLRGAEAGRAAAGEATRLDIAPFARVVTSDPDRKDGCRTNRLQEFRADDVFLDTYVKRLADGSYRVPASAGRTGAIGLVWAERRVLTELGIAFGGRPPRPDDAHIEYWSSGGQVDDWATIGQTLWQGRWEPLPGRLEAHGDRWVYRIDRGVPEFLRGAGTHKVRWLLGPSPTPIVVRGLSALSRARWAEADIRIERSPAAHGKARLETYNGCIVEAAGRSSFSRTWETSTPLRLRVRYTRFPPLPDRTVLRVGLPQGGFGVAVEDVLRDGCVYVRDYGVYVAREPDGPTLAAYRKRIAGRRTVLQRVRRRADQTFDHAMRTLLNPLSNRDPMLLSLACDNRKFVVHREGSVTFADAPDDPGPGQALDYPFELRPRFGGGSDAGLTRSLEGGWMPVPVVTLREGALTYRQRTFVVPCGPEPAAGGPPWQRERPLCVAEFTVTNTGPAPAEAVLALALAKTRPGGSGASRSPMPWRAVAGGATANGAGRLLVFADAAEAGPLRLDMSDGGPTLRGVLPAGARARIVACIPGWDLPSEQAGALAGAADRLPEVEAYWRQVLAPAMRVDLPEPLLRDLLLASQVHVLMAARSARDGADVAPWAASMVYGPLDTEAQPVVLAMDLWGHHEFARRSLDYFLGRLNPAGLLANGYTLIGTGQFLWTLGQHFELTRDGPWLKQAARSVSKACAWIVQQRSKTRRTDADGHTVPEHGLMPPGVLADWERYAYYFYGNGWYYAGLEAAGRALSAIGRPGAARYLADARDFRQEILRAWRWNQARMPVLPLADGTWVPACPSSLYCFGQTRSFYKGVSSIGHDVEVGGQHLVNHGVMDPASRDAGWAVDYLEDGWFFLTPGLAGYPEDRMRKDWFTYGGFAKLQPYYVRNADIYAMRDDVRPFIRTYFNSLFPMLSTETLALWEHFNTQGAWNKTHETAWFLEQTRLMLVMERGDDLWLAPFVTSNWLRDGMTVAVANAPTRFGMASFRIGSHTTKGYIEAAVTPPLREPPKAIVLRLRHPDGKRMRRVTVDGAPCKDFDPARECIRLPATGRPMRVRAEY